MIASKYTKEIWNTNKATNYSQCNILLYNLEMIDNILTTTITIFIENQSTTNTKPHLRNRMKWKGFNTMIGTMSVSWLLHFILPLRLWVLLHTTRVAKYGVFSVAYRWMYLVYKVWILWKSCFLYENLYTM